MSAYLAGLALLRCAEHDRAGELNGTARIVLVAMASFARGQDDPPMCVASHATIATRAGLSVRAVTSAQERLRKLDVIEVDGHSGRGLSYTVRWRLTLLSSARGAEEGMHQVPKSGGSARGAEEHPARGADNPSDYSGALAEGGGRSGASAPSSADAPAAPAPSNEPGKLVAEVMAARGGTAQAAEKWIERKIKAAGKPVVNEAAFIRGCLRRESESAAETKAKPATIGQKREGRSAPQARAKRPPAAKKAPAERDGFADILRRVAPAPVVPPRPRCGTCHVFVEPGEGLCAPCKAGRVFAGRCTIHGSSVAEGERCSADGCKVKRARYAAGRCVDCGVPMGRGHDARYCDAMA